MVISYVDQHNISCEYNCHIGDTSVNCVAVFLVIKSACKTHLKHHYAESRIIIYYFNFISCLVTEYRPIS